jgi:acyl-CoA thioesterase II
MSQMLSDLLQVLKLEQLEVNLFRGESRDVGSQSVFGGQVLGQALVAASSTVEDRIVHSLHAYFLRAGDKTRPIVYNVDRSRDGNSFATRRVVAIQHGEQIFHMSASFQRTEAGLSHQVRPPPAPDPDTLMDWSAWIRERAAETDRPLPKLGLLELPFELRFVDPDRLFSASAPQEPRVELWFKAAGRLPDDENLHRCLLAYASDFYLLSAAFLPHGRAATGGGLQVASIDHAMWFHRPLRVDEWLLYSMDSPSSSGARGLARGSIFTRDGQLVASTAQEGLMRQRKAPAI